MFTIDYLLAAVLLTAPGDREVPLSPELFATVGPAAQQLALKWEILDPREVRYVLARPEDFAADLKLLQRRYHELANAPPLADCQRFPDRATVSDLLAFNRTYRQQMDARQAVELVHWWDYHEAVREADQLYQVWDNVRDARCDYYYVTVRRHALQKLREEIGPEAYYAGRLPPHVPVWRFRHVD
jgi:hypothetical protein